MNIFADFQARVALAAGAADRRRRAAAGARSRPLRGRAAARRRAWRSRDQRRDGLRQGGQGGRLEPARARRGAGADAARGRGRRGGRGRRSRLHQPQAEAARVRGDVCARCWRRARITGAATLARRRPRQRRICQRQSRRGRCMSAMGAAPCSATRSPICWPSPATRSRANITSTTPARRSTCSPAPRSCATARRWAKTIGAIPEGLYPGDYLESGRRGAGGASSARTCTRPTRRDWLPIVRERAIAAMMAMIRDDLAALGIEHDVFFSERSLTGADRTASRAPSPCCATRG